MKYQIALEGFKRLHGDIDKNNHLFVGTINPDFVQAAISALEKQVTKKPFHNGFGFECPFCNTTVERKTMYCDCCGQAIDWSCEE